MKRIAIMGAGSLGTILGAYIAKHRQVDLIDVNQEHVDALNKNGAKIVGQEDFTVPVNAITPDELEGTYDLIIFLVKSLYDDAALASLKPHMRSDTVLVTLQNGFPEPGLIKILGENRVMGATVNWGATWVGPGVSELTSAPSSRSFSLGRLNGKVDKPVEQVKEILELMCDTHVETNLAGTRWAKLLINATYSGLSAALGCTYGDVLNDPIAFEFSQYLMAETINVGDAWGVTSYPTAGVNIKDILYFTTNEERIDKIPAYKQVLGPHVLLKASMLQDLEKNRATEIHALNGLVIDTGKDNNVKTPFNDQILKMVVHAEKTKTVPTMADVSQLEPILKANRY